MARKRSDDLGSTVPLPADREAKPVAGSRWLGSVQPLLAWHKLRAPVARTVIRQCFNALLGEQRQRFTPRFSYHLMFFVAPPI